MRFTPSTHARAPPMKDRCLTMKATARMCSLQQDNGERHILQWILLILMLNTSQHLLYQTTTQAVWPLQTGPCLVLEIKLLNMLTTFNSSTTHSLEHSQLQFWMSIKSVMYLLLAITTLALTTPTTISSSTTTTQLKIKPTLTPLWTTLGKP